VTEVTRGDVASGTELIVDIERAPRRQQQQGGNGPFAG
jgi:hypothetical protein